MKKMFIFYTLIYLFISMQTSNIHADEVLPFHVTTGFGYSSRGNIKIPFLKDEESNTFKISVSDLFQKLKENRFFDDQPYFERIPLVRIIIGGKQRGVFNREDALSTVTSENYAVSGISAEDYITLTEEDVASEKIFLVPAYQQK